MYLENYLNNYEMNKTIGVVYKITNLINGKIYIGQTISDLRHRFAQHKCGSGGDSKTSIRLYNAIKKYGKENFIIEALYSAFDSESLNKAEVLLIAAHNSTNPDFGYNIQTGGGNTNIGRKWSEESKRKMSIAHKGKLAGNKHPMWGKKHSRDALVKSSIKQNTTNGYYGFSVSDNSSIYARSGFFLTEAGFNPRKIREAINDGCRYHKGYLWYKGNESLELVEKDVTYYNNKPTYKPTKEHVQKMNEKAHTPESIEKSKATKRKLFASGKLVGAWKNKRRSLETIAKIVESKSKTIQLTDPNGTIVTIKNVKKFAQENNLHASSLRRVFSGERKSHKGWTKIIKQDFIGVV